MGVDAHGMEPTGRVSGRGCPLAVGGGGGEERYKCYQRQTQTSVESVKTHTNMGNDHWVRRGRCVL